MGGPGPGRDPVSEIFDAKARGLLERAYADRGTWQQAWLAEPGIRNRSYFLAFGINVAGPDPVPGGGGLDAKTRWGRGFVRAINFQHKWYSGGQGGEWRRDRRTSPRSTGGLRVQIGRHVAASPQWDPRRPQLGGLPPRRRVRVMLATGGQAKDAAVDRLADRDRWAVGPKGSRTAGPRWADPAWRDWA